MIKFISIKKLWIQGLFFEKNYQNLKTVLCEPYYSTAKVKLGKYLFLAQETLVVAMLFFHFVSVQYSIFYTCRTTN